MAWVVGWSHILSTVISRCLAQACALIGHNKFTLRTSTEAVQAPGFPVLYSYGQYECTAASLGIDKMKKLVKMMKQEKMIKLVIMRLRSVSGSREN